MKRLASAGVFLIGLAASVIAILEAWGRWKGPATADGRFALAILSGFAGILLLALTAQEFRYGRKSRYAEILRDLGKVAHDLELVVADPQRGAADVQAVCKRVVDRLASIFSMASATKCAVCIKVLEGDPSAALEKVLRPKVKTLARDDSSEERDRRAAHVHHWVDQSTAFEEAATSGYFISNYLPRLWSYKNSSFQAFGDPRNVNLPLVSALVRDLTWTLPYKSTIVVAIRPQAPDAEHRLAGYLCLDSRSRGAFSSRYDVDIMVGVADCLYPLVQRYCELAWAQGGPR